MALSASGYEWYFQIKHYTNTLSLNTYFYYKLENILISELALDILSAWAQAFYPRR
jgi:hypothetical protein